MSGRLYRVVIRRPDESRGRAYAGLLKVNGRVLGVKRQQPGLGGGLAYSLEDAKALADELTNQLPGCTIRLAVFAR